MKRVSLLVLWAAGCSLYAGACVEPEGASVGGAPFAAQSAADGVALGPGAALGDSAGEAQLPTPPGVDPADWDSIERQLRRAPYRFSMADTGELVASNPAHGFSTRVGMDGIQVRLDDFAGGTLSTRLETTAFGRQGAMRALSRGVPRADGERAALDRGVLTEWYINDERGLEQGFTVHAPPAGDDALPLALSLRVRGELTARWRQTGQALGLQRANGDAALRYGKLQVVDADGRELVAWMSLARGEGASDGERYDELTVHVDARRAAYPLVIDPLLETAHATKLNPEQGHAHDGFGRSIAVDAQTIAVGAPMAEHSGPESGVVYVFDRDHGAPGAWGQVARILAPDAAEGDTFGSSVALYGDLLVVGAPGDDDRGKNSGSAYVFSRHHPVANAWGMVAKLHGSDGDSLDAFGYAVAIDAERVVVGAPMHNELNTDVGAIYVFERNEAGANAWGQVANVTPPDLGREAHLGWSVALRGGVIAAGAPADTVDGVTSGAAYLFERNHGGAGHWGKLTKLAAPEGAAADWFGWSVSLDGDTVLVGAPGDDERGAFAGAAHLFSRNAGEADAWGHLVRLTSPNGQAYDAFGIAVSLDGDTAVVGASRDDDRDMDSGSAVVFERNEGGADAWGAAAQLKADDREARDEFGLALAIDGETVVVGVHLDDDVGRNGGSAHIFTRRGDTWDGPTLRQAPETQKNAFFGYSVALHEDTMVVGAFGDDEKGYFTGAAYVFSRNQGGAERWGLVARLLASDAAPNSHFGTSVAIWGDLIVVGAPKADVLGAKKGNVPPPVHTEVGAVYAFARNKGGADRWGLLTKLEVAGLAAGDWFGHSVAVRANRIAVGAPHHAVGEAKTGVVYLFERNVRGADGWGLDATLVPGRAVDGAKCGTSVAMFDDLVLAGAPEDDEGADGTGAAYLFARNEGAGDQWGMRARLVAPDPKAGDHFGTAVALARTWALVGAPGRDGVGKDSGSAFLFGRDQGGPDTWQLAHGLVPDDEAERAQFGMAVALVDERAFVGAPFHDVGAKDSGAAYIFSRHARGVDGWGQTAQLLAEQAGESDRYGTALAVSRTVTLVGASGHSAGATMAGAVYSSTLRSRTASQAAAITVARAGYVDPNDIGPSNVSARQETTWVARLKAPKPKMEDWFGYCVATDGDLVVVGSPHIDAAGDDSGAVFVFDRHTGGPNAWGLLATLTPDDAGSEDWFGYAIAVQRDAIIVGAPFADENGYNSGSAYVFMRNRRAAKDAPAFEQVSKLLAPDGAAEDWFGYAVELDGPTLAVSAPHTDGAGPDSGSVYVFERLLGQPTWALAKHVVASDAEEGDLFGLSMALSGRRLAVGAPHDDERTISGAVYVFGRDVGGRSAWGELLKLKATDGAPADWFGFSLALEGDTMVVGARYDDDAGANSGSVYVFERRKRGDEAWDQTAKLKAPDGERMDVFGWSVDISGDYVAVACPFDDEEAPDVGSTYVFSRNEGGRNAWGQIAKVSSPKPASGDEFGMSVALDRDVLVVGADLDDDFGTDTGTVQLYALTGSAWWEQHHGVANDGALDDAFGHSVAVSRGAMIVGAFAADAAGKDGGSAYIFDRNESGPDAWGQTAKLVGSTVKPGDYFGWSVAMDGTTAVVGAYEDDSKGRTAGAAYVFERNLSKSEAWTEVAKLTAPKGGDQHRFGWSVAVRGDVIAVGAPGGGLVYVYERHAGGEQKWGLTATLPGTDTQILEFGNDVALGGRTLAVGAPKARSGGKKKDMVGAVFLYEKSLGEKSLGEKSLGEKTLGEGDELVWSEVAKLVPDGLVRNDQFGYAVDIDSDVVVAGAPGLTDEELGKDVGAAFVFERHAGGVEAWGQVARLDASDRAAKAQFGRAVAANPDHVSVGVLRDVPGDIGSGAVYVFAREVGDTVRYEESVKLVPSDGSNDDRFSQALAMDGDVLMVGALGWDDLLGHTLGGVYLYRRINNAAPQGVVDAYTLAEDGSLSVDAPGLLANDGDPDGDRFRAQFGSAPEHGVLSIRADGSFAYKPTRDYSGEDTFTYLANDGVSPSTPIAVTLTIKPVNDAPEGGDDTFEVMEDTVFESGRLALLRNDRDLDGDEVRTKLEAKAKHGHVVVGSDGSFTYEPEPNFAATDTFTYRVYDASLASEPVTVTIKMVPVNEPPTATADAYTIDEDQPLTLEAPGLLANDKDVDGDALSVKLDQDVKHGKLELARDGSLVYTPKAEYSGSDSFRYFVSDGEFSSGKVDVVITIRNIDDPPTAVADAYEVAEEGSLTVPAPGVLKNDFDVEGDAFHAIADEAPSSGTVAIRADGGFTYTPAPNFSGDATFTYRGQGKGKASLPGVVTVHVINSNDAPIAVADRFEALEDEPLVVEAPGVLENDVDPDGDALTVTLVDQPSSGKVELGPDGAFTFKPANDFSGEVRFSYRIADAKEQSEPVEVVIAVAASNDPPRWVKPTPSLKVEGLEGEVLSFTLAADDEEGAELTYTLTPVPNGATYDEASHTLTWTPTWKDSDGSKVTITASDGVNTIDRILRLKVTVLDEDGDGLPDTWERSVGLDPTRKDSDRDGLDDADEVGDLDKPKDTDGDGVIDALQPRGK